MLAVSAQCGCCHHSVFHFMPYLFGTFWLYYYMVILLHYNNITWICLIFFSFLHYMVYVLSALWVMLLVGGLILLFMYHHPFICVPYGPYATYSFFFSFLCSVYSFLYSLVPLCFLFPICVFFHTWMKTFGGCGCICIICSPIHVF